MEGDNPAEPSWIGLSRRSDSIRSREDFLTFLRALLQDFEEHGTEWENQSLWAYLEALIAWLDDAGRYAEHIGKPWPEQPDWQFVSRMFLAARDYE
jgi:hypothetical protein